MNARNARIETCAAERNQPPSTLITATPPDDEIPTPTPRTRAEINLANAQQSTGPKTPEGKALASRNSFKHGLSSKQLVCAGEDPAELDTLRATLRSEHQPVNTTEEILVNELAENFWRLRRMRAFEATALEPENVYGWMNHGLLALVHRNMIAAERSFHKALTTLRGLQKDRGFVPQNIESVKQADVPSDGFVPENNAPIPETHHTSVAQTSSEPASASKDPERKPASPAVTNPDTHSAPAGKGQAA